MTNLDIELLTEEILGLAKLHKRGELDEGQLQRRTEIVIRLCAAQSRKETLAEVIKQLNRGEEI